MATKANMRYLYDTLMTGNVNTVIFNINSTDKIRGKRIKIRVLLNKKGL